MKLETFFEKFDQFADAPGAVAKMRELVRDLAVRGRLFGKAVENEANGLPNGWHQLQLGEVAQFINGDRSKNYPSKSFRVDDGVPFINAGHLSNGDVDLTDMDYITPEHFDRLGGGKVERGDVLYCLRGSLGKCAVVQSIDRGAIASSLLIIRPSRQIASRFIYLFLTSPLGARMIAKYDNGSAQPNLSAANVKKYILPLPPLAEQKRIVAKVDELMALCDRLDAQQQERESRHAALARASLARFADASTPANLKFLFHSSYTVTPADLRKSILTLAVQGKLVPQDSNDEPADKFLALIASRLGKSTRRGAMETEPEESEGAKPFDLPIGWAWARFPELGEFGRGKSKHRPRNDSSLFIGGTHRLVQTGDVARANGTIHTHTGLYNDVGLAQSKMWPAGTLCITIAANIADSGILGFNACFPDSVVGFIPADPIPSVRYFEYFMRTAKEHLEQFAPSTAQKNINLGILEQVWIPISPLAEQRRIVAKVDQLMALVDQLEAQLTASRATAANLLAALVAELTTQA